VPDGRPTAGAALAHAHPPAPSLYIHTPFCVHKCHYCDFYSIVDTQDRQEAFGERLTRELRALAPHAGPLATIFVGGGTPSLLGLGVWERLLTELRSGFEFRGGPSGQCTSASDGSGSLRIPGPRNPIPAPFEFTVECNPESTTPELLALLKAHGVNRVSIGAQSFNHRHLKTLERWHNPDNVRRAVELAQAAGIERQSVDLIYAVPGQTLEEWDADLREAISLGTTHLSCYSLTYEPNTAMTARLRAGEFTPIDEDLDAEMFRHTAATLGAAGLARYEVSNFARPGDESLHNLAYWRQEQWLAAGPSASGHVYAGEDPAMGGYRWKNVPRLADYLGDGGFSPIVDLETPDAARGLRERLMMGIRLNEGLDAPRTLRDAMLVDPGAPARLERLVGKLIGQGLLHDDRARWRLTEPGFLMTDGVAAQLMGCI
jgi:oxygen-independent coproporphyrinogen-3 oxidase